LGVISSSSFVILAVKIKASLEFSNEETQRLALSHRKWLADTPLYRMEEEDLFLAEAMSRSLSNISSGACHSPRPVSFSF